MDYKLSPTITGLLAILLICSGSSTAQDQPAKVTVHWDKTLGTSQTKTTLQVVVNPPLERGTPVLYTPWFWRFIMMVICAVPERLFRRLRL